ncbi:unnamed protein product [Caenorhabditis brenneri]
MYFRPMTSNTNQPKKTVLPSDVRVIESVVIRSGVRCRPYKKRQNAAPVPDVPAFADIAPDKELISFVLTPK